MSAADKAARSASKSVAVNAQVSDGVADFMDIGVKNNNTCTGLVECRPR